MKEASDISSSETLVLARQLLYLQQDLTRAWEKGDLTSYEEALITLERLDEHDWMKNYRQSIEPQLELLQTLEDTMKEVDKNEKREEYLTAISLITDLIYSEDENIQLLVETQREYLNERLDELTYAEEKRVARVEEEANKKVQEQSTPKPSPAPKQQEQAQPTEQQELQQLKQEYQAVDRELNRLWGVLKANLSESEFQSLLEEQRQWIKEKEAHAKSEYDRTGGGTTGEIYRHISLIYFTETRIEQLQTMYGYY